MLKKSYFLEELPFSGEEKYRALCLHGLNQNPEALKPFLKDLSYFGVKTYLLHLPEHCQSSLGTVNTTEDVLNSYKEVYQQLSTERSLDLFIGYSYGGLIGVDQLDECFYKKLILLAPALQLRRHTMLLPLILPFLKKVHSIPLGSKEFEKHYRYYQKGVPRSVYQNFFKIYKSFQAKNFPKLKEVQGLVLCNPLDELIHFTALEKWVQNNTSWNFTSLNNRDAKFQRYKHLCFDKVTLSEEEYLRLIRLVGDFLS